MIVKWLSEDFDIKCEYKVIVVVWVLDGWEFIIEG